LGYKKKVDSFCTESPPLILTNIYDKSMEILRKKQPIAQIIELDLTNKKQTTYQKTVKELSTGSWCEENKPLRQIFYYTSYFAAIISLSSAFFWVVDTVNTFTNMVWAAYGIGGIALGLLEVFDRLSSKKVWHGWFFYREINGVWLMVALAIFAGSLWLSIDGEQAAKEKAKASPQTIATNTLLEEKKAEKVNLLSEWKTIKEDSQSYKVTRNKKEMWWPTQKAQQLRQEQIATLSEEITDIQNELKGENHLLTQSHIIKVEKLGNVFLLLVVIFAAVYQISIMFLVLFSRKEYNEETLKRRLVEMRQNGITLTPALATETLIAIEKPLKRKMRIDLNF